MLLSTFIILDRASRAEITPLSLHDALPISNQIELRPASAHSTSCSGRPPLTPIAPTTLPSGRWESVAGRSEEHTTELQSPYELASRLLLEKKKQKRHLVVELLAQGPRGILT